MSEIQALLARIVQLEAEVAALKVGSTMQEVVLLRWRFGRLAQEHFKSAHITPDSVPKAIQQLRDDSIAWVRPEHVGAVVAQVWGDCAQSEAS